MFPHTKSTGQTGRELLCQVPVWRGLNLFCRTVSCLSNVRRHLKVVPYAKTPTFYVGELRWFYVYLPNTKSTGQTGRELLCQVPVWRGLNLFCRTVSCFSDVRRHLKVVPHAKTPTFYVGELRWFYVYLPNTKSIGQTRNL